MQNKNLYQSHNILKKKGRLMAYMTLEYTIIVEIWNTGLGKQYRGICM